MEVLVYSTFEINPQPTELTLADKCNAQNEITLHKPVQCFFHDMAEKQYGCMPLITGLRRKKKHWNIQYILVRLDTEFGIYTSVLFFFP